MDGSTIDVATPDSGQTIEVTPGSVSLTLGRGHEASHIDELPAARGFFSVFEIQIANGLDISIPISVATFRAQVNGLEINASPSSTLLDGACAQSAFLRPNSSVKCSIAFEVEQVPTSILLVTITETTDPTQAKQIREEVTVENFERCQRCNDATDGSACIDLQTDNEHCGRCGSTVPWGGVCREGISGCEFDADVICDGECVDLSSNDDHCGSCSNEVDLCLFGEECSYEERGHAFMVTCAARQSCDDVCEQIDQTCFEGDTYLGWSVHLYAFVDGRVVAAEDFACSEIPVLTIVDEVEGEANFYAVHCVCKS